MRARLLCAAACALLTACGMFGSGMLADDSPGVMRSGAPTPAAAQSIVRAGSRTRAEIAAALGPATIVAFESGWEVWVYRWPGLTRSMQAATELVVLFDPQGVARKVRVRPGVQISQERMAPSRS